MSAGKKDLRHQFERLPMDHALRDEILTGVEELTGEARQQADTLRESLDKLPELTSKLRAEGARGRSGAISIQRGVASERVREIPRSARIYVAGHRGLVGSAILR